MSFRNQAHPLKVIDMSNPLVKLLPELKPNSVITVNTDGMTHEQIRRFLDNMRDVLKITGIKPLVVIPISGDDSIEVLDEDAMRKAGWVRAESE
jgi:hypothetical protein